MTGILVKIVGYEQWYPNVFRYICFIVMSIGMSDIFVLLPVIDKVVGCGM
jgi:hypothetical protein